MVSRRQEKMARVITEAVSDIIANHLSDPRIEGFVSVTRVNLPADLRRADVYVSILGKDEAGQCRTFAAIEHARSRIQSLVADRLATRFCPVLRFCRDEKFKKTLETMRIIDETARESKQTDTDRVEKGD